jgi:hypothetical protein
MLAMLPDDVLRIILKYCQDRNNLDIGILGEVNKRFHRLLNEPEYWEHFELTFGPDFCPSFSFMIQFLNKSRWTTLRKIFVKDADSGKLFWQPTDEFSTGLSMVIKLKELIPNLVTLKNWEKTPLDFYPSLTEHFPNLKSLQLIMLHLSAEDLIQVFSKLKLRKMVMFSNGHNMDPFFQKLPELQSSTTLQTLSVHWSNATYQFITMLKCFINLKKLMINSCYFNFPVAFKQIEEATFRLSSIECREVQFIESEDEDMDTSHAPPVPKPEPYNLLVCFYPHAPTLKRLSFVECVGLDFKLLAILLSRCVQLRALEIQREPMDDHLFSLLYPHISQIEELEVGGTLLGVISIPKINELKKLRRLWFGRKEWRPNVTVFEPLISRGCSVLLATTPVSS